tara:strand:- start:148 stop:378 length:231 start_codon:yes stop_codon:yes gene_type:complete
MKVKMQPTNSHILHANPGPLSFTVGDWNDAKTFYAAVPFGKNKLAIVHRANVIKVCRNTQSAINFIDKHKRSRKKS